jgi:hypothetical protein
MVLESEPPIPGRFSSIAQAKDALAHLTTQLYSFVRSTAEEYKYRRLQDVPLDAVAALDLLVDRLEGSIRQVSTPINFQIFSARAVHH